MCKFHKEVAQKIATDPATGKMNIGHETVIRLALSRYWAERYVDGAENVTGYSAYPMATSAQQKAFERSGLKRPLDEIEREETLAVECLRQKLQALAKIQDLSPRALGLPVRTARDPYIDMAIDELYKGDPLGDFRLVEHAGDERLEPLRRAVAFFQNDPLIEPVLENLIRGKICTLYTQAPEKVNPDLVAAYERLPQRVRAVGTSLSQLGGNIVLGGFSGLIGHGVHYASVLGAGLLAGTASSFNLAFSAAFLLASYGGWNQFFGGRFMPLKQQVAALAMQTGLSAAVVFGLQAAFPHNHFDTRQMQLYALMSPDQQKDYLQSAQAIYDGLPSDLQKEVADEARDSGLEPALFMQTCDGNSQASRDVSAYFAAKRTPVAVPVKTQPVVAPVEVALTP